MTIKDVRNHLVKDLTFSDDDIEFIDQRLEEIMRDENLTLEDLEHYCYADSNNMFDIIFDYKDFDEDDFI